MPRPIKFRAWNKKLKCWVIDLVIDADGIRGCGGFHAQDVIARRDKYVFEQFTGLTDKNGKEIYEGDIVNGLDSLGSGISNYWEVYWDSWRWWLRDNRGEDYNNGDYYLGDSFWDYDDCKVIGNIHENPELLE